MTKPGPSAGRHSLAAIASGVPAPPDEHLIELLGDAIDHIDLLLGGEGSHERPQSLASQSPRYRRKLALLRALLEMPDGRLRPELDHRAPLGHACSWIDESLGLEPGLGLEVLEELADLELLRRELVNRVHVCPKCECCQLNFLETCIECESINIDIERLVHHFHCGYSGLESEFVQGLDLSCPRCRRKLFQLGQDFERPHDTYVCRDCERIFEEPALHSQCFRCAHAFAAREARLVDVHEYRPTNLTVRAVELGRLTGLDVSAVMYDARVQLATGDFLALELDREAHRIKRYGGSISGVRLAFQLGGNDYPIFREWSASDIQEFCGLLTSTLRPLDLVARIDNATLGIFLPETDEQGLQSVSNRLLGLLDDSRFMTRAGRELELAWVSESWSDGAVAAKLAKQLFRLEGPPT